MYRVHTSRSPPSTPLSPPPLMQPLQSPDDLRLSSQRLRLLEKPRHPPPEPRLGVTHQRPHVVDPPALVAVVAAGDLQHHVVADGEWHGAIVAATTDSGLKLSRNRGGNRYANVAATATLFT